MKVAVVQSNQKILYDAKEPGEFDLTTCKRLSQEVIDQNLSLIEEAAKKGGNLIVTMEAINVTIFPNDPRYDFLESVPELTDSMFERFCRLSKTYGIYIVGGFYNKRDGKAYNSGILFGPSGKIEGIYDKVHLAGGEKVGLTPGNTFPVFKTEFGNIGILVCWDMQFPEAARELVLGGADIIVCPTWGWENIYGLSRAYENGIYVAAAMAIPPNGVIEGIRSPSCIVDGGGNILAQCSRTEASISIADFDLKDHGDNQREWCPMSIRVEDRRPETYRLIAAVKRACDNK